MGFSTQSINKHSVYKKAFRLEANLPLAKVDKFEQVLGEKAGARGGERSSCGRGGGYDVVGGRGQEIAHIGPTPSPVDRPTDRSGNITFPQTTCAGGKTGLVIAVCKCSLLMVRM